ncbi:DNA polymerase IV [Aquabacterium lacunae]|uniref:DNA polymerase IV n=1 Tax=Aquabacterium lacunae TaxID=2528630 RepID=A0A4Q9H3U7_9BURK|nr:DNA polymerase IV [Aquabacterium lacunae]TBO31136.1 DNA polymerase IV [Aquabacterium lacunae]
MLQRWIAHLDMDAFYASVELLRHPQLQGQPVVIGGRRALPEGVPPADSPAWPRLRDYAGRGVITTATYPARALGVHSGMGLMKAALLAPDAILLPVDFDRYRHFSRLFKAAVLEIAPVMEDRGIDEIYLDLTDVPGAQASAPDDAHAGVRAVAQRLKQAVREATGLSCSIGVTPNKLLSKLASDMDKPDGLTLFTHAEVPARVWPLPAGRINGIGPKAAERLRELGIETIGQLAAADPAWLAGHFGSRQGQWLHDAAHGRDERPVVTWRDPKSMSRETTFERNLHPRHDREALGALLTRLAEQVAADLARKQLVARTVGVKLRYEDFRIVTRSLTMPQPTADGPTLRRWAARSLRDIDLDRRLRLMGVRVEGLQSADTVPDSPALQVQESLPLF